MARGSDDRNKTPRSEPLAAVERAGLWPLLEVVIDRGSAPTRNRSGAGVPASTPEGLGLWSACRVAPLGVLISVLVSLPRIQ